MFIDHAKIHVKAGNGGNGIVSFYTEKYVPNGGPDGGDGGRGADIVFIADGGMRTLQDFRYKRKYAAEDGDKGGTRNQSGKSGQRLILRVPVGTILRDAETGRIFVDFSKDGEEKIVARGGRGGKGNARFANSVRQAPQFARAGEPGEEWELNVELKLLADVGLVGMPNVGKSTLLSVISAARPKIANYPFTTLVPSLGIVTVDTTEFAVADIPGLIEGANDGAGLGLEFLRHIERTKMLIHVVDVSGSEDRDPIEDFDQINKELSLFNADLATRPQVIAANKTDLVDADIVERFVQTMVSRGYPVFQISAVTGEGVLALLRHIAATLPTLPDTVLFGLDAFASVYQPGEEELFQIEREGDVYHVSGKWITQLVASTNFDDPDSLGYFQRLVRRKGIIDALEASGVKEGDTVDCAGFEFEYFH